MVTLEGEVFQSYVAGTLYDPDRIYWCKAWTGDCSVEGCATTATYRHDAGTIYLGEDAGKFSLFPNPNDGSFRLEVNRLFPDSEYEVLIVNTLGQVVKITKVRTENDLLRTDIELNGGTAGVYYLMLYQRGVRQRIEPFVVQP